MFKALVVHSDDIDSEDAVKEILKECKKQLSGEIPTAGLLFCGMDYDHALILKAIMETYPDLDLIGCTTDGEMSHSGGFTEDAITLTLFCSDRIKISSGFAINASENPREAAQKAIEMTGSPKDPEPTLALILPDGLTVCAHQILKGFSEMLGEQSTVVGGMSADRVASGKHHYQTHQFYKDKVLNDAVPVLLFTGPISYSLGVESGWTPLGKRMRVTSSENNTLHTLDGRPAFELYLHYLGDMVRENIAGIGSYPLAIYEEGIDRFYLRVAKEADPETGTVTFLGEIPEGTEVQITQAIRDEVMGGVRQSVASARKQYQGDEPGIAMMFSCTGRKLALGTRTQEEIRSVMDHMETPIPMTGFYTFGEISPTSSHTQSRYHNTTFVTLLLGEA